MINIIIFERVISWLAFACPSRASSIPQHTLVGFTDKVERQNAKWDKTSNGKITPNGTKRRMEKTPNGTKRRIVRNIEWKKTPNVKNAEWYKTLNETKRRMGQNVE
jgi:hypothetical protein